MKHLEKYSVSKMYRFVSLQKFKVSRASSSLKDYTLVRSISRNCAKIVSSRKGRGWTQSADISTIFNENLNNLEFTEADCREILRSKLGHEKFALKCFEMKFFEEVLGLHGNHGGLKINCEVEGEPQEFRFFVKTTANSPVIKEKYWDFHRQHYKEHVFLTKIHKELQGFVEKLICPKCHLGRSEDVFVLDDCCSMGYSGMTQRYLDIHFAKTGIAALANLHAASIILQEKTGTSLSEKYKDVLYESLVRVDKSKPKENLLHSIDTCMRRVGAAFFTDIIPVDEQDAFFEKVRTRVEEILEDPKGFYKVFCQGDPVAKTNMLFKYRPDGTASDAIIVDFGIIRFGPPAMDVMEFLHLSSTNEFREANVSFLLDEYYDNLRRICSHQGVDVSCLLPRDQFDCSCKYYDEFGMCARLGYEFVLQLPDEQMFQAITSTEKFLDLMVFGKSELGVEAFQKSEAYRKSFREAVETALRFYGYMK